MEREELGGQQRRQSFVDLGCGNGLLVYLLASEGVSGGKGRGGKSRAWHWLSLPLSTLGRALTCRGGRYGSGLNRLPFWRCGG